MERKVVGLWWNDEDVEVVKIDGKSIALDGWNGELFTECWEVEKIILGHAYGVVKDGLQVKPLYHEDTDGDFEIIGYEFC